jgi:hypothetical protein
MVTLATIGLISRVGATMTPPAVLLGGADLDALNATDGQFKFTEIEAGMVAKPLRALRRPLATNANFEARKIGRPDDFVRHSKCGGSSSSIVPERAFKSKMVR